MQLHVVYELSSANNQSIIDQSFTKQAHESPLAANLLVITAGTFLSLSLLLAIPLNPSLRNSPGCYVLSLLVSNLVLLFETFLELLHASYSFSFVPNHDYVISVTFETSILTLVVFSLDRYVTLCQWSSTAAKSMSKTRTAFKIVLTIWSMAAILTAMELNLYHHLNRNTRTQTFVFFAFLFLVLPLFVILLLCCLVTLKLSRQHAESQAVCASTRTRDVNDFLLLVALTSGFLMTMVPYKIVKVIYHIDPSIPCQVFGINVCYTVLKMSTVITPIIYMTTFCAFRRVYPPTTIIRILKRPVLKPSTHENQIDVQL